MNLKVEDFYPFCFEDRYFLLNIPKNLLYQISEEAYEILLAPEELHDLSREAFTQLAAIMEDPEEVDYAEICSVLNSKEPPITFLWMGLTHACNLACKYCFVDLDRPAVSMSLDVAKKAVQWLVQVSKEEKNLSLIFFGGEPLLNPGLIEEVVKYCREVTEETGKTFAYNITTNGTLLDRKTYDKLCELGVNTMVSLDGTKEAHDAMRVDKHGNPTWDRIVNNLRELPNFGDRVAVRVTATLENLDYIHIFTTLEALGFQRIFITEVCPGVYSTNQEYRPADLGVIKENYLALTQYLYEKARKDKSLQLIRFEQYMNAMYNSHLHFYGCSTGLHGFYLTPEGDFYPCSRLMTSDERFKLGNLETGLIPEHRKAFIENHVLNKGCRTCWARFLCGGQCYGDSYWSTQQINEPDPFICELTKFKIQCSAYFLSLLQD